MKYFSVHQSMEWTQQCGEKKRNGIKWPIWDQLGPAQKDLSRSKWAIWDQMGPAQKGPNGHKWAGALGMESEKRVP